MITVELNIASIRTSDVHLPRITRINRTWVLSWDESVAWVCILIICSTAELARIAREPRIGAIIKGDRRSTIHGCRLIRRSKRHSVRTKRSIDLPFVLRCRSRRAERVVPSRMLNMTVTNVTWCCTTISIVGWSIIASWAARALEAPMTTPSAQGAIVLWTCRCVVILP